MRLPAYSFLALVLLGTTGCSASQDETPPSDEQAQTTASEEQAQSSSAQVRTPSDGRSVEQRLEDASLGARVKLALTETGGLRGYAFDTEVSDGRVILRGDVASRAAYERAARVAGDVDGVGEVVNEVTVSGREVAAAEPEPEDTTDEAPQVAANQPQEKDTASAQEEEPAPEEEEAEEAPQDEAVYHTVKSGQSLWIIARQYDVSVSQIQRLNDLRGDNIQPGQKLRVK